MRQKIFILQALIEHRFQDAVYPVNPNASVIGSIRAYPSVIAVPEPVDIAAIEELLLRVSRMVEEIPEISELDLNPIFALPPGEGCRIVDARIRVGISEIAR